MSATAKPKRLDLQGIRGLAILSVLGFHFYPAQFPNGYLGVDQFFVLSGFLMCMLLERAENKPSCTLIALFYSRRFKRILPLYLFVILLSLIALYTFFPDTSFETNEISAIHAMLFLSNAPKTAQDNYFQRLARAVDIFTHTWSLSVEVQFYFLVPFIFFVATRVFGKFQPAYYAIIGLLSYAFFYSTTVNISFNNVFARIWQFMIGMIVFISSSRFGKNTEAEKNIEECNRLIDNEDNNIFDAKQSSNMHFLSYLLLNSIILINILPYSLDTNLMRPLVTLGTGGLMLFSANNLILSNRVLVYIGDISYSLYLIHWPIYAYWKLTCDEDKYLLIIALLFSIVSAIIVFEYFEKWYLELSDIRIGLLIIVTLLLNIIIINKEQFTFGTGENDNTTMSTENAIKMNHKWNLNDQRNLWVSYCDYETSALGWCNHRSLEPSGKYKIAVIGNSWAANHGALLHEECGSKANAILQGSVGTCEVLYPSFDKDFHKESFEELTKRIHSEKSHALMEIAKKMSTQPYEGCKDYFDDFQERIKTEKPDYLFIVSRYISVGEPLPDNITSFDLDPVYQTMKKQLLGLVASTKFKVYILDAVPRYNDFKTDFIAKWIKERVNPEEIDKRLGLTHYQLIDGPSYEMARRRYSKLIEDCDGRCVLVDYKPDFYNSTTESYRIFDHIGYSYFTNAQHLTPRGLEHIRHVWRDVCNTL